MSIIKSALVAVVGVLIGAYVVFDGQQYLSLDFFQQYYQQQPLVFALIYFVIYVLATSLSLPGAALLTIMGGMVFGLWVGVLLVSFASTLGATAAFLMSRFVLRDWVQAKFSNYLTAVNAGVEKDGALYLFSLRLIPLFPFWIINLVMGLMPIKVRTYYWVSQLGMLAGTFVFVNAGVSLGAIDELSAAGILTPKVLLSFALLAVFPFISRYFLAGLQ